MKNILNNKEYHQKSSSTLQRELEEYFNNTDPKKIQEDWESTKIFDDLVNEVSLIDWKIILGNESIPDALIINESFT